MRFYTTQECEAWLRDRERELPDKSANLKVERILYPELSYRFRFFSHWIATALTNSRPTLLWITEWGIWPSSENWHLYQRLRESYGDHRLLDEAPGHLFLGHESEDLASFLQLSMLNGWGGYLLSDLDYVNAFFSHDEYIQFFAAEDICLADVREQLGNTGTD